MAKTKEKDRPAGRAAAAGPRSDAYVMMLFVTLVAIIAGCVLLYMDWDEYGQKSPDKGMMPNLAPLGDAKAGVSSGGGGQPVAGGGAGGAGGAMP